MFNMEHVGRKISELLEKAAAGKLDEYVKEQKVSLDELEHVSPLLKPKQVEQVFEYVCGQYEGAGWLDSLFAERSDT